MAILFRLKWLNVALLVLSVFTTSFAVSVTKLRSRRHLLNNCPTKCHCYSDPVLGTTTLQCPSMSFINKLTQKDFAAIVSLDLSNSGLDTFDKRLKKMLHLEQLNLSHNKLSNLKHFPHLPKLTHLNLTSNAIKSFIGKNLPNNLTVLDISHNFIRELPQDLIRLQSLKRIVVSGNPFTCSPESLDTRDLLLEHKVDIVGRAVCHDPIKFRGRSWLTAVDFDEYFKLHDQDDMQADEMSGSGAGPLIIDEDITTEGKSNSMDPDFTFAGSGEEEGSGEIIPPPSTVASLGVGIPTIPKLAVTSTTSVTLSATSSLPLTSSPSPSTTTLSLSSSTTTLTPTTITTTTTTTTAAPIISISSPEIPVRVSADPKTGTLEESSIHRNIGTHIFLGLLLICLVVLVIYAIKKHKEKKRLERRRRREARDKQRAIELQPKQSTKPTANEKHNGNPEVVLLINGQNGNTKQPEPSAPSDAAEANVDPSAPLLLPVKESDNPTGDYPNRSPNSYSPDVKSVKVKASEIPDSVPHTPILITRSRSSDGKHIVVTPDLGQRSPSQIDYQRSE